MKTESENGVFSWVSFCLRFLGSLERWQVWQLSRFVDFSIFRASIVFFDDVKKLALMVCPSFKDKSSFSTGASLSFCICSSRRRDLKWSWRATFRSNASVRSAKPNPTWPKVSVLMTKYLKAKQYTVFCPIHERPTFYVFSSICIYLLHSK